MARGLVGVQVIAQLRERHGQEVFVVEMHAVAELAAEECPALVLGAECFRECLNISVDAVGDRTVIETDDGVGDGQVLRGLPMLAEGGGRGPRDADDERESNQ